MTSKPVVLAGINDSLTSMGSYSDVLRRQAGLARKIRRKAWDAWLEATDSITGRQRPFPELIIGGGMRCGTTALFSYLSKHPQLSASRRKEVHYFDLHFYRGPDWYKRQFEFSKASLEKRQKILFESSPYYMYDPRVPQRIHDTIPDVKLVFLLRDPIDRAVSHYQKNLRDKREFLSLDDALEAEEERLAGEEEKMLHDPQYCSPVHQYFSYKARGRYAILIKRFYQFFPIFQMLFIKSSTMFKQPRQTLDEVCDFLGVARWQPADCPVVNQSRIKTVVPDHIRKRLETDFEPYEKDLEQLIGWRSVDWKHR